MPVTNSILDTVKKILGIDPDGYDAFDTDIITYINSTFSIVAQLGVGPPEGFSIEDNSALWSDITYVDPVSQTSQPLPMKQLNMLKTYVFLRCRRLFDPVSSRFVIASVEEQITEHEWRLKQFMDELTPIVKPTPTIEYIDIFTGNEVTIE